MLMLRILVLFVAPLPAMLVTATETDRACRDLYRLTDVSHAVEPGVLVEATDSIPAHCRVRGVINRAIRFEVTMPTEAWNGRMMFSTVGGGAGVLGDTSSLLSKGFAMATTDTGHEQDVTDFTAYMRHPEALIDWAYRGVHLATQSARKVIAQYYDREVEYAYFQGCSGAGRLALMEATRFPEDYDGIIAGAPMFSMKENAPRILGHARMQHANPLTEESLELLDVASRRACDSLDGVTDGVIDDPRKCTQELFDLDALVCKSSQDSGCLTPGQIETARSIYSDVFDADGKVVSPGILPGAESSTLYDWRSFLLQHQIIIAAYNETIDTMVRHDPDFDDPDFRVERFDTIADRHLLVSFASVVDVDSADLGEFAGRGGKLLMYQGWNDYASPPQRAVEYLDEVELANGGAEMTTRFFRLFMVPGMGHCLSGPGAWQADYVEAIVQWREKGIAPERIVGTRPTEGVDERAAGEEGTAFSRPLCPYPKFAKYRGRGDVRSERNFDCTED